MFYHCSDNEVEAGERAESGENSQDSDGSLDSLPSLFSNGAGERKPSHQVQLEQAEEAEEFNQLELVMSSRDYFKETTSRDHKVTLSCRLCDHSRSISSQSRSNLLRVRNQFDSHVRKCHMEVCKPVKASKMWGCSLCSLRRKQRNAMVKHCSKRHNGEGEIKAITKDCTA